jgi:hypothetical protein
MNPSLMNIASLAMAILVMVLFRDPVATALCLVASGIYAVAHEIRLKAADKS